MSQITEALNLTELGWTVTKILEPEVNLEAEYRTQKFESLQNAEQALNQIDEYDSLLFLILLR